MSVTLTDVQEKLAYLLGEQSAPATTSADYNVRTSFIQSALERAYRAYDFPFNKLVATIQVASGLATLPTDVGQDSILDIRQVISGKGDDLVYDQVDYSALDNYETGSYKYRLTGYEGAYAIETSEGTSPVLTIRYTTSVPTINASISTPFPSATALARGALIYYRQSEDPQADIGQEEALFLSEIQDIINKYNRSRPRRRMISKHEANDSYIGDLGYLD